MNIEPSIHADNNLHNSLAPPLGDPFILSEFRVSRYSEGRSGVLFVLFVLLRVHAV